jgi:hypothetical protein
MKRTHAEFVRACPCFPVEFKNKLAKNLEDASFPEGAESVEPWSIGKEVMKNFYIET